MSRMVLLFSILAGVAPVSSCSRIPTDPNLASWRSVPGHVERYSTPMFRSGRTCWIYLPPGYGWTKARFPVLYATDGEGVFSDLHVDRICEDLIRRGEMDPIIVVAIENATSEQRYWELSPWPDPQYVNHGGGGGGDVFLRAIRDSLKPAIDAQYRTFPEAANTAITGASLGGLFAAYAGLEYSATFGNVAAFSPSYWLDREHAVFLVDTLSRSIYLPDRIRRYYQDCGTSGDNWPWVEDMEAALVRAGFRSGIDFVSILVDGAQHHGPAWEHRYPEMLRFLYGRR